MNVPDTNAQKHVSHNVVTQTVTLAGLGTSASRACIFEAV